MIIKLAILEKDQSYLNRIVNVFGIKYADKFQIYSFTDADVAFATLETAKIEVMVASDAFEIDVNKLPRRCGFAYFVDSPDIETLNGQRAICKFQKAALIYKQILSVYSENAGNVSGLKFGDDASKIIFFQPVSGGAGASTMAAACAVHFAKKGKKTLYLNLERFGSADVFFDAEGQFDMSDIIFALKSRKTNLSMKLESCVKQADNGVCFYSKSPLALDMMELNADDLMKLITELQLTGSYDYIIVDTDFSIDREALKLYRKAHTLVWVGDGSELSNSKLSRAFTALKTAEADADSPLPNRTVLIYNKFSNRTSRILDVGIRNIGGSPRYEHATSAQILEALSAKDMFDAIM
ncbi:MAG: chromosome partitioning protein ParA [Ruminococcaceae bacterium]|nr:chromosome partitioning protein ParA [Oscillospiraceae bacterium]